MSQENAFYNQIQADYADHLRPRTFLEHLHRRLQFLELHRLDAVKALIRPGKSYLDVGMGDTTLLSHASSLGFSRLCGIDVSGEVIKSARKNLSSSIPAHLYQDDICHPRHLAPDSFSTVTLVAVLEHVFDVHAALSSVHRLLKPGGQLIVEVPNLAFAPRRLTLLFGGLPKTGDGPNDYAIGHLHCFTLASLRTLLADHGFAVDLVTSSGIASGFRRLYPSLLASNIIISATKA